MNAIANSSVAMNVVVGSSTAMSAIAGSSAAMSVVAGSQTAMNSIWGVDAARQKLWASAVARLAVWTNINVLRAITVNSTPDLISETPLNTDKAAGYFTYVGQSYGTANWTAVNINDGGKYIAFIHFYSYSTMDWYTGKIASYNQSTDLLTVNGGSSLTRGNVGATSNGLWVYFVDNFTSGVWPDSYARVWYIKV